MENVCIEFEIKKDASMDTVKNLIHFFISEIKKNEMGTILYKSFQIKENERKFFHIMTFADREAREKHKNSTYCKQFVSGLYPLCTESPVVTELSEIR